MAAPTSPPLVPGNFPSRKRFARSDIDRMDRAGVFVGERLELIDGDLIEKTGQNPPHAFVLQGLSVILGRMFGGEYVRVQLPLEASPSDRDRSLPEPDIAVVRETRSAYEQPHTDGKDAVLVVDLADSSTLHDSTVKRRLYARAGFPKYWVVDIALREVIVHRTPIGNDYIATFSVPESLSVS